MENLRKQTLIADFRTTCPSDYRTILLKDRCHQNGPFSSFFFFAQENDSHSFSTISICFQATSKQLTDCRTPPIHLHNQYMCMPWCEIIERTGYQIRSQSGQRNVLCISGRKLMEFLRHFDPSRTFVYIDLFSSYYHLFKWVNIVEK